MSWRDYIVSFDIDGVHYGTRFIRATSESDARWRVVRKFILPENATITKVEKV